MICESRKEIFVSEIGKYFHAFFAFEIVEYGEVGKGGAALVGKA